MAARPTSVTLLAILHFAFGALFVLMGLFVLVLGISATGFPLMGGVFGLFGAFIGIILLLFGLLDLLAGWGLWKMRSYGRILASIGAVFALPGFPLGTLFGLIVLYWLWVRHAKEFN
ncbi:Uncharacterised protein [uncultured archaeon]|nr:Uncharacterised protein [uncultured archaeon]